MSLPSDYPHFLYFPPGAPGTGLGDVDVRHDGTLFHLFHLTQQSHHAIAHAVSQDGFTWETLDPALGLGRRGRFDDDMLWTMRVMRNPRNGLFHMYYTGCSTREHGRVQRIGLAISEDLMTWRRWSEDPILEASPPHYESDLNRLGFVPFRDPFVFVDDDGGWHMLVTAREPAGSRFRSACIAHATSADGLRWELQEPLYRNPDFEDMEVPFVVRAGGYWHLLFNTLGLACTKVRRARTLAGPWLHPLGPELLPEGNSIAGCCEVEGRHLLFHIIPSACDWPRRDLFAQPFKWVLSPPKIFVAEGDQGPRVVSHDGWERFASGTIALGRELDPINPGWRTDPDGSVFCTTEVPAHVLTRRSFSDFLFEAVLDASLAGNVRIHFRCDGAWEDGYAAECDFASGMVRFLKFRSHDSDLRRYKLECPRVLQSAPLPLSGGGPAAIRLIAAGDYLEFSVAGAIRLSVSSYFRREGIFGFSMDQGNAAWTGLRMEALTVPYRS